jgi:hypothetical protein
LNWENGQKAEFGSWRDEEIKNEERVEINVMNIFGLR